MNDERSHIEAEIPGMVVEVAVSDGDRVREGDELMVLESMKMEIPVLAGADGTVTRVAVEQSDVVGTGDLLAVLEEPQGPS